MMANWDVPHVLAPVIYDGSMPTKLANRKVEVGPLLLMLWTAPPPARECRRSG
jgi:hypothetical protein